MNALNALGYSSLAVFGGWYNLQEIDNYRWLNANTTRVNLLGTYLNQVSSDLRALTPGKKVYSAPFFSMIAGTDNATNHASMWGTLFTTAPGLDAICVQDGLGAKSRGAANTTVTNVDTFYRALALVAQNAYREFGADLESYRDDAVPVPAKWAVVAADPANIKPSFKEAVDSTAPITPWMVHFEQRYMHDSSISGASTLLGKYNFMATVPTAQGARCVAPSVP